MLDECIVGFDIHVKCLIRAWFVSLRGCGRGVRRRRQTLVSLWDTRDDGALRQRDCAGAVSFVEDGVHEPMQELEESGLCNAPAFYCSRLVCGRQYGLKPAVHVEGRGTHVNASLSETILGEELIPSTYLVQSPV